MPEDSILLHVKKFVGYEKDYTPFDDELSQLINLKLGELVQLGIGHRGVVVYDASTLWSDFLNPGDEKFEEVKTFVSLSVKLLHDPPSNSFLLNALKEQLTETKWRINSSAETGI